MPRRREKCGGETGLAGPGQVGRRKLVSGFAGSVVGSLLATPRRAKAAEPPPREPTVLLVGDSHTYGAFGGRLHARLAEATASAVVSAAAGGTTWDTWLEERPEGVAGYRLRASRVGERLPRELEHRLRGALPTLDALLAAHDPWAVVVALGTNRPRGPAQESCERFVARARRGREDRALVLVGPPSYGVDGARGVRDALAALASRLGVGFVDGSAWNARAPLPAANPHFGPDDARRWADAVAGPVLASLASRRAR